MMRDKVIKSFNEDAYERQVIAENLMKIIDSQTEPMVISIDSDWGTGKTTFITMWKNMLDTDDRYKNNFKTLYFNAWENDYIKDPLLAIFSEFEKQIKEEEGELKQKLDKAKQTIKPIIKLGVSAGIRMLTAGILDTEKLTISDYNEEALIKLAGQIGDLGIKEITADKTNRAKFKEEMFSYQSASNNKIIVFIDELDRCRPTFAIELLEVIKHLFDIDNFIFVISIDKEQLAHSVATIYGQDMDTLGYLRRFFDLDYKLPSIDVRKYIDIKNEQALKNRKNVELFKVFLKEMFIKDSFTLRDIDKTYYYIEVLLPFIQEFKEDKSYTTINIATISYIYSLLITTKIKNPTLYKKVMDGKYDIKEITSYFKPIDMLKYGEKIIGGFHPIPLTEIVSQIVPTYLELNFNIVNGAEDINYINQKKYLIGLGEEKHSIFNDRNFNMLQLFRNNNSNIRNNLEFLNGFNKE
ncbi:MAG: P-loop NTPase fold protein [Clostridium paraputrificum]